MRNKNYQLVKLDARYSHRNLFKYVIKFHRAVNDGPYQFARSQKWFFDKFGYSPEVEVLESIQRDFSKVNRDLPVEYNSIWSYGTNPVYNELRIYVNDEGLAFFKLAFPVDQ